MSWDEAHEAYLNHLLSCSGCYAPTARYCPQGAALWAEYLCDYAFTLDTREARRSMMVTEKHRNPHIYPQLDALVRARLETI